MPAGASDPRAHSCALTGAGGEGMPSEPTAGAANGIPSQRQPVRLSWCDRTIYRKVFGKSNHRRRPMADPLRTTPPSGPAV